MDYKRLIISFLVIIKRIYLKLCLRDVRGRIFHMNYYHRDLKKLLMTPNAIMLQNSLGVLLLEK